MVRPQAAARAGDLGRLKADYPGEEVEDILREPMAPAAA
jgi:hypothetical protein